jgi:predicted nucleic acid-binding protein
MPLNPHKTIISDTACLIGLANIGRIEILREMYGSILVTPEVAEEYGVPLLEWVIVQAVHDPRKINVFNKIVGLGESSAIALALEIENSLLIVDDRRARRLAIDLGLEITGTLGVIIRAYRKGVIDDIDSSVASLQKTGFRLPANAGDIIKTLKS